MQTHLRWIWTFALAGCASNLPGESVGTFSVSANLETNTCGDVVGAQESFRFEVELRQKSSLGYWHRPESSALISGSLSDSGAFHFTNSTLIPTTITMYDEFGNPVPVVCTVSLDEDIAGTLTGEAMPSDAAAAGMTFTAVQTIDYVFTSDSPSECRRVAADDGSDLSAVPCSLSYALTAERR